MITLLPAYSVTIKIGEKLFAGHVDNSLSIVPNYDPILRKSLGGRFDLDFVSVDLDMQVSGLTYERTVAEEATHNDFADLRAACSNPVSVAFIYGDITPGKIVLAGNAKLSDYQERAGSGKICGTWSCRLRSIRGTVQEEVVPPAAQDVKYGLLYNWYAATDARGIASDGWRNPTVTDLSTLMRYLDPAGTNSSNTAGGQLKEAGLTYWNTPNTGASNLSKFNARGAGTRGEMAGNFNYLNQNMYIWPQEQFDANNARISYLYNTSNTFYTYYFGGYYAPKKIGASLRPVKISTSLTHGQEGTYTGNDGRVYRTICIGTQEWLADNLCETKFRTGEAISEVTDNAAWAALTTAGMCAYNNDWTNV